MRRRRPQREIPFSFDSFLDVVANVVGIILRLILVAWVGGRSYQAVSSFTPAPVVQTEPAESAEPPALSDPLAARLDQQDTELAAAQQRLLEQVRLWEEAKVQRTDAEKKLADAADRAHAVRLEREAAERAAADAGKDVRTAALSPSEIQSRVQLVHAEIDALKKLPPPPTHALRYKTPVSQPLQTEELFFECRAGRVAVIDVGAMLDQMHRDAADKAKQLATEWQTEGVTDPVGPYRMRYTLERERGPGEGAAGAPLPNSEFRYGVSWMIEPLNESRGEGEEAALAAGSDFRKVVDALDPRVTAVTFWVYADSFPLYRRLRDSMHDRDFVVAGRPLLEGMPIGSSRHGTASRGQ